MAFTMTLTFQAQVLSLLVNDQDILDRYRPFFTPSFFDNIIYRDLSNIVFTFYDEYEAVPSKMIMQTLLEQHLSSREEATRFTTDYNEAVSAVYGSLTKTDLSFIKTNLEGIIKYQLVQRSLFQSQEYLSEEKYDQIIHEVDKASTFTFDSDKDSMDWDSLDHFNYPDNLELAPIPTGYTFLDNDLHGGLRPSELGIFVATTGGGKSLNLVNLAQGALNVGKRVLYVTLEMSNAQVARRLDSLISHVNYWDLDDAIRCELARKEVASYLHYRPTARLKLKFFPTRGMTVRQLGAYIKRLTAEWEAPPELVLVDYGDILKPAQVYQNRYDELGSIYEELKGLAQVWEVPIWTASQGNRQGVANRHVGLEHLAESFKKAFVADTVLCLSQTDEEKTRRLFRLSSAKVRSHGSNKDYHFSVNYDQCKITEVSYDEYNKLYTMDPDVRQALDTAGGYKGALKGRLIR